MNNFPAHLINCYNNVKFDFQRANESISKCKGDFNHERQWRNLVQVCQGIHLQHHWNQCRCQFHQCSSSRLYAGKSQKLKVVNLFVLSGSACAKAVSKTLMKLTPGVNFINIKCMNFSYARWFWQLFSSYMYIAEMTFIRKICTFNVDEIDGR